jgi:hypothetical protein
VLSALLCPAASVNLCCWCVPPSTANITRPAAKP